MADQWRVLLDILDPKLTSNTDRSLMAAIRAFTGKPHQLAEDSHIKRMAAASRVVQPK